MRITGYHRTDDPALSALAEGARALGHRVTVVPAKYWRPGDLDPKAEVVVVVGLHGSARQLRDLYVGRGVPVWVMDLPRLRTIGAAAGFTRNGLHWLPAAATGKPPKTPGVLKGRTPRRILVIGQKPNDAAHGLDAEELNQWARGIIADLRGLTALPIHYRAHPLNPFTSDVGADAKDDAPDIRTAMQDAALVVTYNSTCGWDAIDAGVPVLATAPREEVGYADYCTMGLPVALDLTPLPAAARREALARVAGTCWTLEQLRDGTAIAAMLAVDFPAPAEAA